MRLSTGKRRGNVAVMMALSLTAILGVVALVVDGGLMLDMRRRAQAAADAAALAAADDLYYNYNYNTGLDSSGTAKASALSYASANGFSNDGTTNTVTVNIPPVYGDHVGVAGYVEVVVQFNMPRGFSGIFGSGTLPVKARAVARGSAPAGAAGLIALNLTAQKDVKQGGNGPILLTNGASVWANSSDGDSLDSGGSGGIKVTGGGRINVVGGYQGGGFSPAPTTGVSPIADPLGGLAMPDPVALGLTNQVYSGGTATLNPGIYTGGINVSGTLTLKPGIYYMKGGSFIDSSDFSVTGTNALIYTDSGDIVFSGNGNLTITPPTSGPYAGISLMVNRAHAGQVNFIANGSGTSIGGAVYAAKSFVDVSGDGPLTVGSIIGDTVWVEGNGTISVNNSFGGPKQRLLGLVE